MALEDEFLEIRFHEIDTVSQKVRFSMRIRGDETWMFMDNIIVRAGSTLTMSDNEDECSPGIVSLDREIWTETLRKQEV